MFDRVELKARGKEAFKNNYWKCVIVSLIMALVLGATAGASGRSASSSSGGSTEIQVDGTTQSISDNPEIALFIFGLILGVILLVIVISLIVSTFVTNPLTVGCRNFFLRNSDGAADLDAIEVGFKPSYMRNVKAMFLVTIKTFLWALLFIIPGIIKALSYRLVPYILSEDPDITPKEALAKSAAMMDGYKKDAFILDLSFFGWLMLTALTLGIAGIFYVNPYMNATDAELYKFIRDNA